MTIKQLLVSAVVLFILLVVFDRVMSAYQGLPALPLWVDAILALLAASLGSMAGGIITALHLGAKKETK